MLIPKKEKEKEWAIVIVGKGNVELIFVKGTYIFQREENLA